MSRGFACVALVNPKSAINVGSALRAAGCFGASLVVVSGVRPDKYVRRMATDVHKSYRHIPMLRVPDAFDALPYDCVPIAIEILPGSHSLVDFVHPERAFYVFGPEDGTLGRHVTSRCRFVVTVPTRLCMNLAATVNVVLYDRAAKTLRAAA